MSLENPVFGSEPEKKSFSEIKQESLEDYDSFVKGVKSKVDSIKQRGEEILKKPFRAMKPAAEKMVKSAITLRNIKEYGFMRFGKEAARDAAGELGGKGIDLAQKGIHGGLELAKKGSEHGMELAKRGRAALNTFLEKRTKTIEKVSIQSEEKMQPINDQYDKYLQLIKLARELGLTLNIKIEGQLS